jgi:hypothetical protein
MSLATGRGGGFANDTARGQHPLDQSRGELEAKEAGRRVAKGIIQAGIQCGQAVRPR